MMNIQKYEKIFDKYLEGWNAADIAVSEETSVRAVRMAVQKMKESANREFIFRTYSDHSNDFEF